jgi:hypothetical protein
VLASVGTMVVVTAVATAVAGTVVVPIGVVLGVVVGGVGSAIVVARRRQLDGDGYGAIVEIMFVSILAGIAVQIR